MVVPGAFGSTPPRVSVHDALSQLVAFHPARSSGWVAAEAAVAVMLLPAVFAVLGRLQFGLVASLGSLVAIYLTDRSRRERAAKLPLISVWLLVGVGAGIVASGNLLLSVVALCGAATVFSFLSLTFDVGPPGAIFPVLATGVAGQLTAPTNAGYLGMDAGLVILMVALGAFTGYAVTVAPLVSPRVRAQDRRVLRSYRWRFTFPPESGRIFTRLAVVIAASATASLALGLEHVGWVILAVVGILERDSGEEEGSVVTFQRLVGAAAGVTVAVMLRLWVPEGALLVALVGALAFGYVALVRRNALFALMLVSPLALLLVLGGSDTELSDPTGLHMVESLAGALLAAAVLSTFALVRALVRRALGRRQ